MFLRRKLYQELGGYPGYRKTPLRELQECRLSIIAEMTVQAERDAEQQRKQEEAEAEARRNARRF